MFQGGGLFGGGRADLGVNPNAAPASAQELFVAPEQIGDYNDGHFQLSDNFFRQQLAVPTQLDRSLPGAEATAGRQRVVNKAFRDDGPGPNMARAWGTSDIETAPPPEQRVAVERFFEPTTHGNDADYAIANSYMPAPTVQFYGKENEEDYPIWGMNGIAVRELSAYPEDAAYKWGSDGMRTVQNTSSELENDRRNGGVGRRGQLGAQWRATDAQTAAAHGAARGMTASDPGEPTSGRDTAGNADEPMALDRLPGGQRADELSLSYHNVGGGVHESAYGWKDSELVHSSLLDIRTGSSIRSNALKDPRLPLTPFNLPGHSSALGNV